MDESTRQKTAEELESAIRRHNFLYWIQNAPEISDYEYDQLVERLKQLAPESAVLTEVGAGAAETESLGRPVVHERPMLSLDKCYEEAELRRWSESFSGPVLQSPKVDGVAASFRYDERGRLALAATRGDGRQGEEFTANALLIPGVPNQITEGPLEVRGEVYMPLSAFARHAGEAANPRNLAAGTLKRKQSDRSRLLELRFFAYDLLGPRLPSEMEKMARLAALGFPTVEHALLERHELQAGYEAWLARRDELDFELDGVVYKTDDVAEQARLSFTAHHPKFAIAYKFQGESGRSVLRQVEWSVARTGAITPVALIDPVRLSGAEVTRCSLHNLNILRRHGLHLGDTVIAMRRGGVIPHIEASLGGGQEPVTIPTTCPSCGQPTNIERDTLRCGRPDECDAVVLSTLEHFVKQVGIEGFGESLLRELLGRGWVRSPADLFSLTGSQLVQIELVGDKLAHKLMSEIDKARTIPLDVFLAALGIQGVGRQVATLLAEKLNTLEAVRAQTVEDLYRVERVEGKRAGTTKMVERKLIDKVGRETAASLVEGLRTLDSEIDRLLEHVKVRDHTSREEEGPWAGQSVVFTGKLSALDRKTAQQRARAAGAATPSDVTKDLTTLVVGDEGSPLIPSTTKSSKQVKAEKYNAEGASIEIISETEFLRRLG